MQFCANNPSTLLHAAELVQDHCDAVDINLGCPQRIARKGKYGAFLMEQMDLIESLVTALAQARYDIMLYNTHTPFHRPTLPASANLVVPCKPVMPCHARSPPGGSSASPQLHACISDCSSWCWVGCAVERAEQSTPGAASERAAHHCWSCAHTSYREAAATPTLRLINPADMYKE